MYIFINKYILNSLEQGQVRMFYLLLNLVLV